MIPRSPLACLLSFFIMLTHATGAAAASGTSCMATHYQTREVSCVDGALRTMPEADSNTNNPGTGVQPNILGFLTGVFLTDPKAKAHVLTMDVPPRIRSHIFAALRKAGLEAEAANYKKNHTFETIASEQELTPLAAMKPRTATGDNDTLIGAYWATGNADYLKGILGNYADADDNMVGDGLRMAMMQSKFGDKWGPPGREGYIAKTLCEKYDCKKDIQPMMRVMTLATAFWALSSMGRNDPLAKKTLSAFFLDDPRLRQLQADEAVAFNDYMAAVPQYLTLKDTPDGLKKNPAVEAALVAYETLQPGVATLKKKD